GSDVHPREGWEGHASPRKRLECRGMRPRRLRLVTRSAVLRIGAFVLFLAVITFWGWSHMIRMPGKSFSGPLPALQAAETEYRERLRRHVEKLAGEIGERDVHPPPHA